MDLHCNWQRCDDPQVGRFVSKDPIGLAGGINVYQYAPSPITWTVRLECRQALRNGEGGSIRRLLKCETRLAI
nr:RHS repeat-associated core domain-containing protein [Burkholderia territorii]